MNLRSLPLLLLAVLVLGGLWYFARQNEPDDPGTQAPRVSPLLAGLPGPPDFLQTWNADGTKEYHFAKGGRGLWELRFPIEDDASEARIENLLSSMLAAQKEFVAKGAALTPKMLEETELAQPLGKIVVGADGVRIEVVLGGEDVFRGEIPQSFALVDGDLYKIPTGLETGVRHNLHEVRSPLLFHADPRGLHELTMTRRLEDDDTQTIRVQKQPSGEFRIVAPIEAPADSQRLAQTVLGLLGARARRYVPIAGTPPSVFEEEPWLTLALVGNYGEERARIWRSDSEGYHALVDGRAVVLVLDPESFRRVVLSSIDELVDRTLWPFPPQETARLRLLQQRGDERRPPLVLQSRHPDPGFRLIQPREGWADSASVARLFDALTRMNVQKVLLGDEAAEARRALSVPELVVQLDPPPGRQGDALELQFARRGSTWIGQRAGSDYVLVLADVQEGELFEPWYHYVERVAFRVDRRRLPNRVVIHEQGQDFVYELSADAQRWERDGQHAKDFEARLWDRLLELKAERVLGDVDPEALPEEQRLRTIEVQHLRAPGATPETLGVLRLYSGEGGRLRSHREGQRLVFELWEGFRDDLLVR